MQLSCNKQSVAKVCPLSPLSPRACEFRNFGEADKVAGGRFQKQNSIPSRLFVLRCVQPDHMCFRRRT